MYFENFLKRSWQEGTEVSIYNVWSTAALGGSAHLLFYFLFKYYLGIYENLYLRIIATVLCLMTVPLYKMKVRWFQIYWHVAVTYVTSFIFTVYLIKSNFNELWIYWEIFMIFVLIMHIPNWFMCLIDLLLGVVLAIFYCIVFPEVYGDSPDFDVFIYSIVIVFSIFGGTVFNYANRITAIRRLKKQHLQLTSLAGSIVHELRNPLGSIGLAGEEIARCAKSEKIDKEVVLSSSKAIEDSISSANGIINIILNDLSAKEINSSDFSNVSPYEFTKEVIDKFGYKNKEEKSKVVILPIDDSLKDILIRVVPDRFSFIIYNLLKNSLYYIDEYPDAKTEIGVERRDGKICIYVYDNGPGIHKDVMPRLFEDFFTSGKKDGTGLGLSFCKRNMNIFGGDIICESEFGKWTKFSLIFPEVSKEDLSESVNLSGKRSVLIVDDEKVNLMVNKARIEKKMHNIACDICQNPKEAINMVKDGDYGLVLSDFEMPDMSGFELSKALRKINKKIPIIIFSSLRHSEFLDELHHQTGDFNQYLRKSVNSNILFRSVSKWLFGFEDDMAYLGQKEEYIKGLKGRNILLADDQDVNRKLVKKKLESLEIKVTEVTDGDELLKAYKNSLDANKKTSFDMILTDINMPKLNGDEATKEIRKTEIENLVRHSQRIPIIALTGDGNEEDIRRYLACKITDYYIKGSDPEMLVKIMANYLISRDPAIHESVARLQKVSF